MSDDRNKNVLDGLGDLDWDNALDEWEKNAFSPEVARDAESEKKVSPFSAEVDTRKAPIPAPVIDSQQANPAEWLAEPTQREAPRDESSVETALPPPEGGAATVKPSGPLAAPISEASLSSKAPEGTLIAPVPNELREASDVPPARPSSPPSRGGLDQLFSRPKGATPSGPMLPVQLPKPPVGHHPSERTRVVPPAERDPGSVTRQVASAPAPPLEEEPSTEEPSADWPLRPAVTSEPESERTLVKGSPLDPFPPAAPPKSEAVIDGSEVEDLPSEDDLSNELTAERRVATVARASDEENETLVRDRGSLSDADTATRLPADDEMPTIGRPSAAPPALAEPELPVSRWLDEDKARAFQARIVWLEEEARAITDPVARARALLAVSELCALVGDRENAFRAALEARDAAPTLPLPWRQARQLMAPSDVESLVDALDAEAASSETPSARAHATLLAADILRVHGFGDAAVERWERACKLDPADTRAPIARAALALAQDDHTSGALHLSDNSELITFDKAVATALRLRGVERPGAEVDEMPINDALRHARDALGQGDVVAATQAIGEIAKAPALSKAGQWLAAAIGAAHIGSRRAAGRALRALTADPEDLLARRQLAARGIELGDPELVKLATTSVGEASSAFDVAERAVVQLLAEKGDIVVDVDTVKALGSDKDLLPLEDAVLALTPVIAAADGDEHEGVARARRVAGRSVARASQTLGRLLGAGASDLAIDEALEAIPAPRTPSVAGVAIESAVHAKRWSELSEALSSLPTQAESVEGGPAQDSAQRHIAAAMVAERGEAKERAKEAWLAAAKAKTALGHRNDGLIRIASDLDSSIDLGRELLDLADEMPDTVAAALLRLEGMVRLAPSDEERGPILERVHRAAPQLGLGAFLAEHVGRRRGDLDEVLRWIHERRSYATDPLETALDAVREALLIADREPDVASTRLEEAHRARPDDVALRELHERLAPEPPADRGAWRERRAEAAQGKTAALLWTEAALEHERSMDYSAALAAARRAAEKGDRGLSRPMIERAEIETGETTRIADELLELTKTTENEAVRREALERLVYVDAFGKKDPGAALLWHRSILEATPHHKPSLRWVEHVLVSEGRDDELGPIFESIALALDATKGGEVTGHAQHAARLRARDTTSSNAPTFDGSSGWERTADMARLAATQPEASLWALRALNAHARARKDEEAILSTTLSLLDRTQRPPERAALLLRASESAARLDKEPQARDFLERAATEDPGDVVTWGFLAEVRERAGEARAAAEACESLARTSVVPEHQLLAWHDAAKIWLDEAKDSDKATGALEAAAEIDVTYADVFPRLSALYADKRRDADLARLLEKRLGTIQDEEERVALEVELSRAFAEMGEIEKAKASLQSALEKRPDHTTALSALAELCAREKDWTGAEQAYVRLARLTTDPSEQRDIYARLGEIYSVHAPNLSRAETAWREVQKRAPNDVGVLHKLVDVYKRANDVAKAVETQQEIIAAEADPNVRLQGLVDLASIYETVGHDPRRSEQVLDSARKEFPTSVVALRAMAEFYARQRQMPAMQILLDRAAGDARRSFAQGRFVPSLFQVLHAAFELRGKRDAARVVAATLAAVEGQESDLAGAEARAVDPRLDDLLAPEAMSPPLRALLQRAGDALDAVAPANLQAVKAAPLQPGTPIGATVGSVATVVGLGALQILVSPTLGRVALPLATNPPTLLVGEALAKVKNERARMFVVVRAMKMILARASALLRGASPQDIGLLVGGLFCAFNPSYAPQGIDAKRVSEVARRIGPAIPRNIDPTVGVIALEAAGMVGTQWNALAPAAAAWANRVALLAVGDPNAALDALAWGHNEDAAPTGSEERAAWIARHADARDLMTFSVTDAYAEARIRLGVDH